MKSIFLLTTLITSAFVNCAFAEDKHALNEFESFVKETANSLCGIEEYISCLNISKSTCTNSYYKAVNQCPRTELGNLGYEIPDIMCTTDKFIESLNLSDKVIKECDLIMSKKAEAYSKKIKSQHRARDYN